MKIGKNDVFERQYMQKFRVLAAEFGEFVEYERDRAARDIGLHLTARKSDGSEIVSPSLVWFQLKGIQATTMDRQQFKAARKLQVRLETPHLRFWYLNPQPTYLVLYVESEDRFFVRNIKKFVEETYGDNILTEQQKTMSVPLSKDSELDQQAFSLIFRDQNLVAWQKRIHDDEKFAAIFFRDSNIIKRLGTAKERGTSYQIVLRKYLSKLRSEVEIVEIADEEEIVVHTHWQYMMPDIEEVFPYISLSPLIDDEEEELWEDEDEDSEWPPLELSSGKIVKPDGGFEITEYHMNAELNKVGLGWLETLNVMTAAGYIEVNLESHNFVSVAPWHARDI